MKRFLTHLSFAGLLSLVACASPPTVYKDVRQGNMFVSSSNPSMSIQVADDMEPWESIETSDQIGGPGMGEKLNATYSAYPFVAHKNGIIQRAFIIGFSDLQQGFWRAGGSKNFSINGIPFDFKNWGPFVLTKEMLELSQRHNIRIDPKYCGAYARAEKIVSRSRILFLMYIEPVPESLGDIRDWKTERGLRSEQKDFIDGLGKRGDQAFKIVKYSAF
jgi:hypothetical protein